MSAPWQVYKEIERKDDELFKWAREHKDMFEKSGDEVVDLAAKLMKKHKKMGNRDVNVERADAYVVAQAHHMDAGRFGEKPVVVTEEGDGPGQIPRVARSYGLRSIGITDMMKETGLAA